MSTPDFKPCPFCGGDNIDFSTVIGTTLLWAHCWDCEASGPLNDSKDRQQAAKDWNQRNNEEGGLK